MTVVSLVIGALLVLLASCATAEPAKSKLGIEAQRLSEEENALNSSARGSYRLHSPRETQR